MPEISKLRTLRARMSDRLFGGASARVFRGMAILAVGSSIGRLLGIASLPVLTRLYSPEDFGTLAVFTALVAIIAPLVTMRYSLSLPLPSHDGVAMNLLVLSTGFMLFLTGLFALMLWLWGARLSTLGSMEMLASWWWLLSLGVLGTATYELLTMWATRKRAYKVIAQTSVIQSVAGALVKILFGLASVQPLGLLIGQVVAQAGGSFSLLRSFTRDVRVNWHHVTVARMRKVALRHRHFPIYRMPSQMFLMLSQQTPILFATTVFGATTGGQFGLAIAVVSLPIVLMGSSVAKALYGEAAHIGINNPELLLQLAKATQWRLFVMALGPTGILFIFGPSLFRIVFGPDWEIAGHFASIFSIYLIFQFTSAPLIQMMNLLGAQHLFLLMNTFRLVGVILLLLLTTQLGLSDLQFVTALSLFNTATYLAISVQVMLRLHHTARRKTL